MLFKYLFFVFILFSSTVFSQSITGKITDLETQESLQYVNIFLKRTNIGTVSNIYGEFDLSDSRIRKTDSLVFSSIGYTSKTLVFKALSSNTSIKLKPYSQNIEKVTVKEKRTNPTDILVKAFKNCKENIYSKKYQTNVFSRNFLQKDTIAISYRKTLFNATSTKDFVWHGKGEISADKYLTLPKNINEYIKDERIDYFRVNAQSFSYPRQFFNDAGLDKALNYISNNIVKIDTVIFSNNSKIYVVDNIGRSINPRLLPKIYSFIKDNPSPYTAAFDKEAQNNIEQIFETNNFEGLNIIRYYIDATQNYNIIKTISFYITSHLDIQSMQKSYFFEYVNSSYTNKPKQSILKHSLSFRKTLYTQKEMYKYYDFNSLYEYFSFEPKFNKNDSTCLEPEKWQETISSKYATATDHNRSKSFDRWDNKANFIKTDTLEERAVDQILYPEKYYDVDQFYAQLDSVRGFKFKKEKRIKPKVKIPYYISGTIIDSLTQEALQYSNIIVKNIEDTSKRATGAMCNEDGEFKLGFVLGYKYQIQISQLGYKTFTDTFDLYVDPSEIQFFENVSEHIHEEVGYFELTPESNQLGTVTVKGQSKYLDLDKESTIVTNEMRKNTIAAKDLFHRLDGVVFNKITEEIKVDGSKKVKVLLDGVEKSNTNIFNLNPKRIKKIEILRNISGLYAVEGYTAIVNVITYDNYRGYDFTIEDQFIDNLGKDNSSNFRENYASVNLNVTRDKWSYFIKANNNYENINLLSKSFTKFSANDDEIINGNQQEPNQLSKSNSYDASIGVDYKLNKKHLFGAEIGLGTVPKESSSQSLSFDTISVNGLNTILQNSANSNATYHKLNGNFSYHYKMSRTSDLITYLYVSNKQTVSNQNINDAQQLNYEQISNDLNYKLELNKTFRNRYTLTVGGRYLTNNFKSSEQNALQEDFTNHSSKLTAYSFLKIRFDKTSGLLVGCSFENYQSGNNDLNSAFNSLQPKLNLFKTFPKKHKLVLSYSLKTKYPFLSDLNPQIRYITPFEASMGNVDLSPFLYHQFAFQYNKINEGFFSYFSLKPYYNYSDNEMGLNTLLNDSVIVYQSKNFVKHEKYGLYTNLSFNLNKKIKLNLGIDVYKDWNKNLDTDRVIDWIGDAEITYAMNSKQFFGLMYQKEFAKNTTSLGYTKEGANYLMIYWMTLQLKGRLQFMLGYSLPLSSNQLNEAYEQTPYYTKHSYTDMSFTNNMIMLNLVFRLSKGTVQKNVKNIDYENYENTDKRLNIGL